MCGGYRNAIVHDRHSERIDACREIRRIQFVLLAVGIRRVEHGGVATAPVEALRLHRVVHYGRGDAHSSTRRVYRGDGPTLLFDVYRHARYKIQFGDSNRMRCILARHGIARYAHRQCQGLVGLRTPVAYDRDTDLAINTGLDDNVAVCRRVVVGVNSIPADSERYRDRVLRCGTVQLNADDGRHTFVD